MLKEERGRELIKEGRKMELMIKGGRRMDGGRAVGGKLQGMGKDGR